MIRKIIQIDEEKCNGCGLCANACHEGAIKIIDGKARLVRDDYCDGLGDCLPSCPQDAITFVEREALPYDEQAVAAHLGKGGSAMERESMQVKEQQDPIDERAGHDGHSCPGSRPRFVEQVEVPTAGSARSMLTNWPVQLKLAPTTSRFFDGAHLLVAADCCAYSYARFHEDFIRSHTDLIGCPKLDGTDYTEKLTQIIRDNNVKSLTIARMEVPCCGGLQYMATEALKASGKFIPWRVVTFGIDGSIIED